MTALRQFSFSAVLIRLLLAMVSGSALDHVLRFCKDNRLAITNLRIQTVEDDASGAKYAAEVSLRGAMRQEALLQRVRQMPGIVGAMGL